MRISVKKPSGEMIMLDIASDDMIPSIKDDVQHKEGIPIEFQELTFSREFLQDNKTLNDYHIQEESTLNLIISSDNKVVRTYIQQPGGRVISLDISTDCMVNTLRTKAVIRSDNYGLIFAGKKVEDGHPLSRYNIQKGSLIHLVPQEFLHVAVHIKSIDQKELACLKVHHSETVLNLKSRIWAEVAGMSSPSQQRLHLDNTLIVDSAQLREYGLDYTGTNTIVVSLPKRIYVSSSTGSTFETQVHSSEKVEALKRLVQKKTSVAPNRQQMFYGGKLIEDRQTIASYNFVADPMLHHCKSECIHDPLQEKVSSEGKQILWKQYGVTITIPPGAIPESQEGVVEMKVYDGMSASCFDYPHEYSLCSSVYEIYLSTSQQSPPEGVQVSLTNFKQPRSGARLCVMEASRNPSRWKADRITPVYIFREVEGLQLQPGATSVDLNLSTFGCYVFLASHLLLSQWTRSQVARPSPLPVQPGASMVLAVGTDLRPVKSAVWQSRASWRDLGRALDLSEGTIDSIKEPNDGESLHMVLKKWMQTGKATIQDLLTALEDRTVDRTDIANEVRTLKGKNRTAVGL